RSAALRSAYQLSDPHLDVPVEAPLGPPAKQKETQTDKGVSDGRGPRVSRDAERHFSCRQVLDHFIAEAPLLEVALQRLVTPAPHALPAVASIPFFIDDPGDPDAEVEAQAKEPPL